MMFSRRGRFTPLILFVIIVCFLGYRLILIGRGHAPNVLASVMIDRAAPSFSLPPLDATEAPVNLNQFKGRVVVVNFFASWCESCQIEHRLLAVLKENGAVLIGVDYKDRANDAKGWLKLRGNPYDYVGRDQDGRVGIDFGLYGVPETYIIDKSGIIRFKQTGPLTTADIDQNIRPVLLKVSQ